jgi:hypothetical protein
MSAEAIIGTGVTIGTLGVLFLLLGWAQWLRAVHGAATTLLLIGAVMAVVGIFVALSGRSRRS